MANEWAGIGEVIRGSVGFRFHTTREDDKPSCPYCDDQGFIIETIDGRTFSRPCDHCKREEAQREERQFENAQIPRLPMRFIPNKTSEEYLRDFNNLGRDNWILFTGRAGSGKTTNAAWIATGVIKKYKQSVRFYSAYNVVRRIVQARRAEREKLVEEAVQTPFIVLDDFLKVFPRRDSYGFSDFQEATLEIIWGRYDAKKPLCITTQVDFKTLAQFDAALAGRIVESCNGRVVSFGDGAKNWRLTDAERTHPAIN